MEKIEEQPIRGTAFKVLVGLSIVHCLNDLLQSVVSAIYPLLADKADLALTFAQVGLITLVYQMSASIFQPIMGLFFDRRPFAWSLPLGMSSTMIGMICLAFSPTLSWVLFSVALVGLGSSVLHPEASRLTSLASGGRRGLAQSLFQVGGNFGGSLGPLVVALIVAPYGRSNVSLFAIAAFAAILIMIPVCLWYKRKLQLIKIEEKKAPAHVKMPLDKNKTIFALVILLLLMFSKYVYMASLTSYYTFYLIHKFGVSVQDSQFYLFIFLVAMAAGTLMGGPIGDKIGRRYVIWGSILGAAPFTLFMPYVGLTATIILSFLIGLILSSAFPAILLYAQELLPYKLGLISGLFFGLAFGIAGIASAVLGYFADHHGIEAVYKVVAFTPLIGLITIFLPDLKNSLKRN
jgi:Sugar phosphate permease